MDTKEFFQQHHERIVDIWFRSLSNDRTTRYHREPSQDLRAFLNRAAVAFRHVMLHDDWTDLKEFIIQIAQKRFNAGFKVSEVQKAFEFYRQTLITLLFADLEIEKLEPILIKLQKCMVFTITQFSEYFQGIHENFLRNHNNILEHEIKARTREIAESREKYKTLVEDINDGFFVLAEDRVVFANRSFARMLGYELDQVLQTSYLNFIAEEHREVARGAYELSLENGNIPTGMSFCVSAGMGANCRPKSWPREPCSETSRPISGFGVTSVSGWIWKTHQGDGEAQGPCPAGNRPCP